MAPRAMTLLVLVASGLACASGRDGFTDPEPPFSPADAGCIGQTRCSRDLRAVVEACDESRVVLACAPDQGCADGTCLPACDAAVGKSASAGCEFVTLVPSRNIESSGSCFAAFIANNWATSARLEAEYGDRSLDLASAGRVVRTSGQSSRYEPFSGELQPGEVVALFLAQSKSAQGKSPSFWTPCPEGISPAVLEDTSVRRTGRGSSFRIKASAPVSAYSVYPFGGGRAAQSTATLLLPVPAWKTEYIATTPWGSGRPDVAADPVTQIVAAENDTEVTILGSATIEAGDGVDAAPEDIPTTYLLSRGETLQLAQREDLFGSRIVANKNIAVFGGHECLSVPAGVSACDYAQLQLFPVHSWGHEYAAVPYLSRRPGGLPEGYFYRVVAAAAGTSLTYEPARPPDAPTSLDAGGSRVFLTDDPFVVRSQDSEHPIALYSYMTGGAFSPAKLNDGDPEFTFVIPSEQYLDRYAFYVDTTFRNSHLVVVRSRPQGKDFEPVLLDCAGPLVGWKPVGSAGRYEFVHVRLTELFLPLPVGSGTCGAGRHEIVSGGPFSVTVWGTDAFASYAYAGGAAIRTLNEIKTIVR